MLFVPIGGFCSTAVAIRKELKLSDISLPFDYLRCNFECILENIQLKFCNFLPIIPENKIQNLDEKSEYIGDYDHDSGVKLTIYKLKNHCFFHHNLYDINVINAFKRRIDRFNKLLYSQDEIIFVRLIISKTIMEEVNKNQLFFDVLKNINADLKYKLIFISSNNENIIKYKKINDNCALITSSQPPTQSVEKCILFYKEFGFLNKDVMYDGTNLIESLINYNDDDINLYPMDVHDV